MATLPFALNRLGRGRVHIGALRIRLVLQSFCSKAREKPRNRREPGIVRQIAPGRSRLARLLTWTMLKTPQDIMV